MRATGLSWIQIYKWLFDRQMKDAAKNAYTTQLPMQIFRVIGQDGREIGTPAPIFAVEKVSRKSK